MEGNGQVISVKNLLKRYDSKTAIQGISFEVCKGEIFGILGPNSAGKTTILEIIEGLREQDSGTVTVCGLDTKGHPKRLKEIIGAQLQVTSLFEYLTVEECLALFRSFYKAGLDVQEVLEKFHLLPVARKRVSAVSAGQKQRVGLAAALINDPEVVFLDEPTANLDPEGRQMIWDLIRDFKSEGKTVLLSTNDIDEAEALCDRVAIIAQGRLLALDSPADLKSKYNKARLEDVFISVVGKGKIGKVSKGEEKE